MSSSRPHATGRGPRSSGRAPRLRSVAVLAAALLLAACSSRPSGAEAAEVASLPAADRNRMVFDSVWAIVRREHVDSTLAGTDWDAARRRLRERAADAPDERALYRTLAALLAPLADAHTYVTTPTNVAREQARRTAARDHGLGMQIEAVDGGVVVTGVQPASAAGRAGVQPGWLVRRWNGIDVDSAALAAGRFGAGHGDTVAIAFADTADSLHELVLAPSPYEWRHPRGVRRDGEVAVVRLTSFEPGMGAWFVRTVAAHRDARAMVVDLRGNPGGQMKELSLALDALFAARQPVGRFIGRDGKAGPLSVPGSGRRAFDGSLVVLVDRRSGSAAEIFASVVQGVGRGRVVGERTAGAVLNAFPYRLPDGGRLHVSRRDFRDVCGMRLERAGLEPIDPADRMGRTLADLRHGHDPALARAMAWLRDTTAAARVVPRGCA